ncbi:MAG TPA: hypothetical protein VGG39_17130 [Polyangiaceae bacterium]
MRVAHAIAFAVRVAACSGGSGASVYVSATCPTDVLPPAGGIDAGRDASVSASPSQCKPLPTTCAAHPSCDCVACAVCDDCTSLGGGEYENGSESASCNYDADSGIFSVQCQYP